MRRFKGYKTIGFAVVTALVPVLSMADVVTLVPVQYTGVYMLGVAGITAALRAATTSPLGAK